MPFSRGLWGVASRMTPLASNGWHWFCVEQDVTKFIPLLAVSLVATGCASTRSTGLQASHRQYDEAEAAALTFESPIAPAYPLPGLDREPRQPWAFAGFEGGVTEFYAVSVGDSQSTDPWNTVYDRVSVSTKVGVRYR